MNNSSTINNALFSALNSAGGRGGSYRSSAELRSGDEFFIINIGGSFLAGIGYR